MSKRMPKDREGNAVRARVFQCFYVLLLYLGTLHKGYEVYSETAGLAPHVPASKTKD